MDADKSDLHVKALYRTAKACLALEKPDEAYQCIERGLKMDPKNAALKSLIQQVDKIVTKLKQDEEKKRLRDEKKNSETEVLVTEVEKRNVKLYGGVTVRDLILDQKSPLPVPSPATLFPKPQEFDYKIHIDPETSSLVWPMIIVYSSWATGLR